MTTIATFVVEYDNMTNPNDIETLNFINVHQFSKDICCNLCITMMDRDIDEMLPLAIDYSEPIA